MTAPQPTRCLLCRAEVYDQAALCPACEEALDDTDSAVRAQQLDAPNADGEG